MPYGYGFGRFYGRPGWGRGNPYPFCRAYPYLPRGWWRYGYGYPGYYGYGYPAGYTAPVISPPAPLTQTPAVSTTLSQADERTFIENEMRALEERMEYLKKRLEELTGTKKD